MINNNKKAARLDAGTAQNTAFNGNHCNASSIPSCRALAADDTQKPSRQNRRLKRTWKNRPKKQLTAAFMPWQSLCTVLNTPPLAVSAPVSHSGFFTSIGFDQWPGSVQLCNSLRVKAASGLMAVFKYLAAPLNKGRLLNEPLGAIMAKQKRTRAHSRFTVYNFIRKFTGPVVAYRLSFAGRAA
jgi:hypothetical protein